ARLAARVDELEVAQVGVDVQGDPVIAHAALDPEAQRPDLPRRPGRGLAAGRATDPAARMAVTAVGGNAQLRAGRDHRLLERGHERAYEEGPVAEPQDRIGDELAGAVVRDLAAPLDPDDLDPAPPQLARAREDMALVGLPAERQDGIVLEQ